MNPTAPAVRLLVITWIFITDGVRDIAFRLSGELQPLYLDQEIGLSLAQIGLLGSVFSIAMMLTPMLSGRISDRYGERVPISGGFLLVFFALVVFLLAKTYLAFIATWAIFGAGVGLLSPAYQSLISKVVPRQSLGAFSGLCPQQPGIHLLASSLDRSSVMGALQPEATFLDHGNRLAADYHPHLAVF